MDEVLTRIKEIAGRYPVGKVVLFGSRARGDHSPRSDYDFAVFAPALNAADQARFGMEVEEIATLKKIDLVFVDGALEDELLISIEREGVVVYEQTGF